jgi:hypothetical protein
MSKVPVKAQISNNRQEKISQLKSREPVRSIHALPFIRGWFKVGF